MKRLRLIVLAAAALFASVALPAPPAGAAELVMLVREGCVWCKRWNEEIGPIYPRTAEARIAPLRVVDIDTPWPDDLADIRRERLTPTFILVENGIEIGRLRGYAGDEFFWSLLGDLIKKLPKPEGGNERAGTANRNSG